MGREKKNIKGTNKSFDEILKDIGESGFLAPKKERKIEDLIKDFENSKDYTDNKVEFWYARDLQKLLQYTRWENFLTLIQKSKKSCEEEQIQNHFHQLVKMVKIGSATERKIEDYKLTRYACYLIAMNGDPKKKTIQFAQNYFAIQTRKQELQESNVELKERIEARRKLAETEKKLSGIVYKRGFTDRCFGIMRSEGDKALFGGRNTNQMKNKLNIPKGRALADFTDNVIVKGKDFAAAVTSHNVVKDDLQGVNVITKEHILNNENVRKYLLKRNIIPEDLPPQEDIKKVEKKLNEIENNRQGIQEEKSTINISTDLWKYALLIIFAKKNKEISTKDLKEELLKIKGLIPQEYKEINPNKQEPYYYQVIRNLKSNKKNKNNFITQGYCEDIKGGFKITEKGTSFVRKYFKDIL